MLDRGSGRVYYGDELGRVDGDALGHWQGHGDLLPSLHEVAAAGQA